MRKLAVVGVGLLLGFGGITGWALEGGGVAVLETRRPEGGVHGTHVWFVETEDGLWVEAGEPESRWLQHVRVDPRVHVVSAGPWGEFRATPAEDPARRPWLRAELRRKYGWRDRWVGLFLDATRSVPVHLAPAYGSP